MTAAKVLFFFGPTFMFAIALCLFLTGVALYPLIGTEAWDPLKQLLGANTIAQTLAISGISGTLFLATAALQNDFYRAKHRGDPSTPTQFLTRKGLSLWGKFPASLQLHPTEGHRDPRQISTTESSTPSAHDLLIASVGITSTARHVQ